MTAKSATGKVEVEVDDLRMFNTGDAAKRLDVSPRMLQKLIASGELRSVRIGRLRKIPASEIRRVIAGVLRREVVPEVEPPTRERKGRRSRRVGTPLAAQIEPPPIMRAESDGKSRCTYGKEDPDDK